MTRYLICQYQGLLTIVSKEVHRFMRIWIQTLLPAPITAFLYFMVFTQALSVGSNAEHFSVFMSPGLILMSMMNNSFSNTVGSFFGSKFQRHIEEILISPLEPIIILLGFTLGGMCRGLLIGSFVYLISLGFEWYSVHSWSLVLALSFLTTMLFSLAGLFNAIYATKFDDISVIPTFVLTPLIYLGGIFYSIQQVKGWLYQITLYNPIYYLIEAFRGAMLGSSLVSISHVLITLCIINMLFFILNWILIARRVGMGSS